MNSRQKIVAALVEKFKQIDGTGNYTINLYGNCIDKHKFWDEVQDFPTVCVVAGQEQREYLPGGFKWGHLGISIKAYVKDGDDPAKLLEELLSNLELAIDDSTVLTYGNLPGEETADIRITNIITDEGLLIPYGVGELSIIVQYQVLKAMS